MQTAFVTGASGFIGSHLVDKLHQRGVRVKCLVRPTSQVSRLQQERIELIEGTIDDPASYCRALSGCDTVIHLAGLTHALAKQDLVRVNGTACGQLADACRSLPSRPRLIYVSSLAAAGPPPRSKDIRDEFDEPNPISNYGLSKRLGESELQKRAGDLPITVVRPGIVYGPGDAKMAEMVRPIYRAGVHFVVGLRTPPISLIYVDDLVDMILDTCDRGETLREDGRGEYSPEGYYFACDDSEFPNYWQLGHRIGKSIGRRVLVWPMSRWAGFAVGLVMQSVSRLRGRASILNPDKVREATVRSWACSCAKARQQLAFRPALPLDVRIKQMSNWYLEHGWL